MEGAELEIRKKKVALHVVYNGSGYSGMQFNPGAKTIESTLEAAIVRAGGITKANAGDFLKSSWMRSARTDKGVSACGQVVSFKMMIGDPQLVSRINAELPPEIRVLGYTRVIGGFDARHACDRRRYEYILPAFAFDPTAFRERAACNGGSAAQNTVESASHHRNLETTDENTAKQLEETVNHCSTTFDADIGIDTKTSALESQTSDQPAAAENAEEPSPEDGPQKAAESQDAVTSSPAVDTEDTREAAGELEPKSKREDDLGTSFASEFQFGVEQRQQLNDILAAYVGTHNFHNFTTGVQPGEGQAKRYILSFQCQGTIQIDEEPWVRLVVTGQSFMLHQVRKMVGLAVAVMRGAAPLSCMRMALSPRRKVRVPIAPDVGLFLDECIFASYNARWTGGTGEEQNHEPLGQEPYQEQIAEFKAKLLYPQIAARDKREECTATWLRSLNDRNYEFSSWHSLPEIPAAEPAARGRGRGGSGGSGSALIVGAQETYGVPGHKRKKMGRGMSQPQGWKRRTDRVAQPELATAAIELEQRD